MFLLEDLVYLHTYIHIKQQSSIASNVVILLPIVMANELVAGAVLMLGSVNTELKKEHYSIGIWLPCWV